MGEIYLSWVNCKDCRGQFPIPRAVSELGGDMASNLEAHNLEKVKYCPFCGSVNLDFNNLNTQYYG